MRTFELSWRNAILSSLAAFAMLLLPPALNAQCTNAPNGQWPTSTIALASDNATTTVTTCAYTGEFSVVSNVQASKSYTVTGSGSAMYITITNADGSSVIDHGMQPFTFTAPSAANIRIYRHESGACGTDDSSCRTITVTCNNCEEVGPTCEDGIQNGDETGVDCGGPDCPACPATCDDGMQNGDETGVDCGGPDCEPCEPVMGNIPTMSEWGLIIFGLIMFTLSLVFGMSYQRTPAMAGSMRSSASQRSKFPFNQALYFKLLPYVYLAIAAIFVAAIVFTGYELTSADIPGSIIAGGILAYLVHFVLLTSKRDEE